MESQALFSVSGSVSGKYDFKTAKAPDEQVYDHDLFEDLQLDITMPQSNLFEFHFLGSMREDLNGESDRTGFFPFEDIGDTRKSSIFSYTVYLAHFDANHLLPFLTQVRAGRQNGRRDEPVFFDGIAADIALFGVLNFSLYGGAAVHFFEIDYVWGSDLLGGLGLDYAPFESTIISLDYLYAGDQRDLILSSDRYDHLVAFKVWQRFYPFLKVLARFRSINITPRDVTTKAVATFPGADLEISAAYFLQFNVQNELSNELSSFYDIIGRSFPYHTFDVKTRKLLGKHLALDLGFFLRILLDDQDRGSFNRNYSRIYTIVELIDLLTDGLTFGVTGELWRSEGTDYYSAGLDIEYSFNGVSRKTRVNAGTYFSLYKYDYYIENGERELVQTYYVKGVFEVIDNFTINGGYEFEYCFEYCFEPYHSLRLGARYDF